MFASLAASYMNSGGGGGKSDYMSYHGGAFGDVVFGARAPVSDELNVNQLLLLGFALIVVLKVIK